MQTSPETHHLAGSARHFKRLRNRAPPTSDLRRGMVVVRSQQMFQLVDHTDDVASVAFSPGAEHFVTGSADAYARIWAVEVERSPQPVLDLKHGDAVSGVDCPRAKQLQPPRAPHPVRLCTPRHWHGHCADLSMMLRRR